MKTSIVPGGITLGSETKGTGRGLIKTPEEIILLNTGTSTKPNITIIMPNNGLIEPGQGQTTGTNTGSNQNQIDPNQIGKYLIAVAEGVICVLISYGIEFMSVQVQNVSARFFLCTGEPRTSLKGGIYR